MRGWMILSQRGTSTIKVFCRDLASQLEYHDMNGSTYSFILLIEVVDVTIQDLNEKLN